MTLALVGELDLASAADLDAELQRVEQTAACITLDLVELSFVDSTGLHVMFAAHRRAATKGHRFAVTNLTSSTRRLLCVTGLDAQFVIV